MNSADLRMWCVDRAITMNTPPSEILKKAEEIYNYITRGEPNAVNAA